MLVAVVSMLIDGIMTSYFLGDKCLAAYGLTNPVNMFLVALGGLIATGSQVMGGRCAGNKDDEGLNRILTTSSLAGASGGLLVTVVIAVFVTPLCRLLGAADAEMTTLTSQYLMGISFCMPALVIAQIFPSFLQLKDLRKQLVIAALSQITADVVLDYLNVKFFHGGLWGMAMATVVSCYLYVALLIIPAFVRGGYKISFRYFSWRLLGQICNYGMLYLVYKVSVVLMNLFLNRSLSAAGGVDYLAANTIIFSVELIIGAVPSGFGSSTSLIIGVFDKRFGRDSARKECRHIVALSVIVNAVQILLVVLLAKPLVMIFSPESEAVLVTGVFGLRLYVLAVLPNTINYIVRNYLQSIEKIKSSYIICVMNHLVLPLIAGFVLEALIPINYIWLCFVIGHTLCLLLTWIVLRKNDKGWRANAGYNV